MTKIKRAYFAFEKAERAWRDQLFRAVAREHRARRQRRRRSKLGDTK